MKFSFSLDFDELPRELQDQKIDEYLTALYEDDPWYFAKDEDSFPSIEEVLTDEENRNEARYKIEAHFPVYF